MITNRHTTPIQRCISDNTLNQRYCIKGSVLTGEKPCINKGFLVLLMHRKFIFNMIVPGALKLFRNSLFYCHNTINWWCNRPIKMDPLKKDARLGFELCFSGRESATLLITLESHLYCNAVRSHLIQSLDLLHFSIDKLRHHIFEYTSSCRETEFKTMLSSYFYDPSVRLRVKKMNETYCKISATKSCRMAQQWIRLVHHGNYCIE